MGFKLAKNKEVKLEPQIKMAAQNIILNESRKIPNAMNSH